MYGNSIYFRAVAQREVRLCEFVDEAGLELHRNSDDHQNDDHAALLAVFPSRRDECVAIPIYFRAVAQGEVRPCQIVDEAGLELHHRGLNALLFPFTDLRRSCTQRQVQGMPCSRG